MTFLNFLNDYIVPFITFMCGTGALALFNFWQRRRTDSSTLAKQEQSNVEDIVASFNRMQMEHIADVQRRNTLYLDLLAKVTTIESHLVQVRSLLNQIPNESFAQNDALNRIREILNTSQD